MSKIEDVKPDPAVMKQIQQQVAQQQQQQQQHGISNGDSRGVGGVPTELKSQQIMGGSGSDLKTQILNMEAAAAAAAMKYPPPPQHVPQPAQNGQASSQQQQHQPSHPGATTNLGDLNNLLHEGNSMIY